MAESSILYKTGEHAATIKLIECHRDAFAAASAPLNSLSCIFGANASYPG
jgi:hypothetical protein